MLWLSLTLLMAASPSSPADAYLNRGCPPSREEATSNIEMKAQAASEAHCVKKAMNRDLDRLIVPLKRKAPEDYKKWMELQARYNRWMQSVCATAEELNWVDFETRLRSDGTARGTTDTACQTALAAERGAFAARVAAGDLQALRAQLQLAQQGSEPKRAQLKEVLALLQEAEAWPVPPVDEKDQGVVQPITPREWHDLRSRVEGALTAASELARDQCALLPSLGKDCPALLERSLVAMIPFSNQR